MKSTISVIIPTYNNSQLQINLQKNMKYLKDCEIIVVNDNPKISLANQLTSLNVRLINHKNNKGFAGAINTGIYAATCNYILLLNDDVLLRDNSFQKAIDAFNKNRHLFAVSFAQIEKNGKTVGKNVLFWKNGFIQHSHSDNLHKGKNGWAEGGSAIFDAKKLKQLNGFDELYSPFYWEDIDLSYRAKKYGFEILFDPSIKVIHHHETTIGQNFSKDKIHSIAYRNQLICIWKNISSISYCIQHIYHLLKLIALSVLKNDTVFLKGFLHACILIPRILWKKLSISHTVTDHEIFKTNTQ